MSAFVTNNFTFIYNGALVATGTSGGGLNPSTYQLGINSNATSYLTKNSANWTPTAGDTFLVMYWYPANVA